jgi:hypothetical protein
MRIANGIVPGLKGIGDDEEIVEPGTLIRTIRIPATIVIIPSFKGSIFQCQESKGAFKLILSLRNS